MRVIPPIPPDSYQIPEFTIRCPHCGQLVASVSYVFVNGKVEKHSTCSSCQPQHTPPSLENTETAP